MNAKRMIAIALLAGAAILLIEMATGAAQGGIPDAIRGGLMWDKWWVVVDAAEPEGDHPLYPPEGIRTGSTTFRCKECHGWDYKGVDGAYASGSHFTGIIGVFGSTLTPEEMFDLIKFDEGELPNGHGFGDLGMSDVDILDVVEFVQTLVIDTDTYIAPDKTFLGDPVQGEINYTTGGSVACVLCHGETGTTINFGGDCDPEWVGTIAAGNPWEFLHKGRIGQPGSAMPSWLGDGGTDQGVADMGRYAQLDFPVGTCDGDSNQDGFVDFNDLLQVLSNWGMCQ